MPVSEPPSSDAALLAGLSAAVSGMIGFGAAMYWLMQPTVLPSASFDWVEKEKRAPVIQHIVAASAPADVERLAVAMAARENERQGLRPIATAAAEPAPTLAHASAPTAKVAKRKRVVARAPRRDAQAAYASNWWGGGPGMFGGFGGWYR